MKSKIPSQHTQEQLSRAYIHAVVSNAGQIINFHTPDYGTDCTIKAYVDDRTTDSLSIIDVQLKATTLLNEKSDHFIYNLEMKAVNFLKRKTSTSRIVAILNQPEQKYWVDHNEQEQFISIKNLLYWIDSAALPAAEINNTTTFAVKIPKTNIFNKETIDYFAQKSGLFSEYSENRL